MTKFLNSVVLVALFLCLFVKTGAVLCGGHHADSCFECPQGNGAGWCNGVCMWDTSSSSCVDQKVDCGEDGPSDAETCDDCGSSEDVCQGECSFNPIDSTCRPEFSNNVRTASVHLSYTLPSTVSEPSWWLQRIEPVSSSSATYFCGVGNSYGYGGIQQVDGDSTSDPPNGKVIFSIWDGGCDQDQDPDCDPGLLAATLICGTGVTCTDFGGEGTGRKSYFSTDQVPVVGQEYFMAVHAEPTLNDRVIMTGYFYSESTGWRLLSKIDTNQSGKPWYLSGLYSFVEQWTEGNTLEPRDAMYGPSFISGDDLSFKQIIDAKYDYGTPENHEHVNGYFNAESNAVGIATGGDIEPVAFQYQIFGYNEENSMPAPLDDFKERIGCLIGGTTADEIDDCLTKDMAPPDGDEINVEDTIKGGDSGAAVGLSPSLFNLLLCATVVSLTWRS
ncbi:hypothetical protein TrCOL_g11442 [Triparma columacea]|uniref:Uncharacterized protein n=1 Tax=Triparma columacea TaxID=722753 RepID=A0A9W7GMK0_9STRA|nr:hypothetical protein TrCOL_g11442 [Triparma columacea]